MPYPWSAGNVLTATDLNSALAAKSDLAMVQNAQTGTSYSYALADASKLLSMSNAASNTVLVTKQATVAWVTSTQLRVINLGTGVTTLVADTGVTINGNVALKQYQGGTLIRTASDVWLFVPTASSSGMDLVTPTSVAGSGVTLSGGQVSFSAATTVSVNGCFTSAYQSYLVIWDMTGSAAAYTQMRMRLAGTDTSTATYRYGLSYTSTSGLVFQTGETGGTYCRIGDTTAGGRGSGSLVIQSPALAVTTLSTSTHATIGNWSFGGQSQTDNTAFDGLTVFPLSGTITGVLRIYGLRNS